ncbi:MAG: exosortase-associated EpsI family protein [Fimbriimonadaceae bacterium]
MTNKLVRTRLAVVAACMAVFGLAFSLRQPPKRVHMTERWMEDSTPFAIDGYRAEPGPNGDKQTYRATADTYKMLEAYGIVNRVFTDGLHSVDVCVIASNSPDSLHDPMICFPGSGWQVLQHSVVAVPTRTRGVVPFSVMSTQPPESQPTLAAYCFKGPASMLASQVDVWKQWKLVNFLTGDAREGSLYRFIADPAMTQAQLLHFAADYLDAVKATSKGIL